MAKKHKKKHYSRNEILAMCNQVARESRMCNRTPYTAMPILVLYTMLKSEGWKQTRLVNFNKAIQDKLDAIDNGTADVGKMNEELYAKTGFPLTYNEYTEEDITFKKGTFDWWITERQLYPQNEINKHSLKYLVCWFACLTDMGYGKTRLQRVQDFFDKLLEDYRVDKTSVRAMHAELISEGIMIEQPIDPLTQERGSMMTV